jgi:hypothetical protein
MRRRRLRRTWAAALDATRPTRHRPPGAGEPGGGGEAGAVLTGLLLWPFRLAVWAYHRCLDNHDRDGY